MLIAFIAFLVCFELPRPAHMFETDEPAWLSSDGKILSCRLLAVSPTSVRFSGPAGDALELAGCRYQIHLDGLGWTDISMVSRSGHTVLARLELSAEQHDDARQVDPCEQRYGGAYRAVQQVIMKIWQEKREAEFRRFP